MSLKNAKEHLGKYGLDSKIIEFDTSSATVKEAAIALNCKEAEIAKTLSFLVNNKPILIIPLFIVFCKILSILLMFYHIIY